MRPIFMTVIAALALAGCYGPTAYQAEEKGYGFSDRKVEDDRYRVSFAGNSITDRETVETYLLYRAAEVTLAAGGDYFQVADRDTEVKTHYRSHATTWPDTHFLAGKRLYYRSFGAFAYVSDWDARPVNRYTAYADIIARKGEKPADDPQAYDARELIERLGPSIVRPKPGKGA